MLVMAGLHTGGAGMVQQKPPDVLCCRQGLQPKGQTMLSKDFVQDFNSLVANMSQDQQLAYHKRHIQVLWNHIERLEEFISTQRDGSITIAVGQASITLKKNGDISIKGNNIDIKGMGSVEIKGSKVVQN
jgi:hypothetical protein